MAAKNRGTPLRPLRTHFEPWDTILCFVSQWSQRIQVLPCIEKWIQFIPQSFLQEELKDQYKILIKEKAAKLHV